MNWRLLSLSTTVLLLTAFTASACEARSQMETSCETERRRMVDETIRARGVEDERVLEAMLEVRRERFLPARAGREVPCVAAHSDSPMSIGAGQTISQPYIVAFMSEAALIESTDRCLEIGTGSGYQAAVLAELCQRVWSIEYIPELAKQAEQHLRAEGYGEDRVVLRTGDGYEGWPEAAPFDVIVVTAAPPRLPPPLLEQLAPGGRLIAPVGPEMDRQELILVTRIGPGNRESDFERRSLLAVRFVPFVGRIQQDDKEQNR